MRTRRKVAPIYCLALIIFFTGVSFADDPASLEVRVMDEGSEPFPQVRVLLSGRDGHIRLEANTGPDGHVRFSRLAPGGYWYWVDGFAATGHVVFDAGKTGADTLARTMLGASELPVGAVTALIGGPLFSFLLSRRVRYAAL